MYRDPTLFRERFKAWKAGKKVYENGLPSYLDGKDDGYQSFLKTLPENLRTSGAYNTRRYWELNDKPKNFTEAVGKGMYTIQNDNGTLNWHAGSIAYNKDLDQYELMKSNYHPTRWMELVYGYDQSPEFLKDWKVLYNGPMLSDRYVRREKPGLKIKGGLLPKFATGKEGDNIPEWLRKKLEGRTAVQPDNTAVRREPAVLPIKKQVAKSPVVPNSWIEKQQLLQPTIRRGKSYTQRRIDEETKRTWLSDAADIAHGAGEGAMFAANFIPFAGEFFAGGRALLNSTKSYLTHPFYKTVYHGSPYPFDIKNAWTATANDIGLHTAENKLTADIMKDGGGIVYKLRIPPADTETIDIGMNGARLLSTNFEMKARPNTNGFFSPSFYNTSVGDNLRIKMIRDAGGNPTVINDRLFIENPVRLNIRDEAYPGLTPLLKDAASQISRMSWANTDSFTERYISPRIQKDLNQKANDLLSNAGYKVIKYHNANPFEGGGTAYMITDPSVMDVMQTVPKGFYYPFISSTGGLFGNYIYNKYAE